MKITKTLMLAAVVAGSLLTGSALRAQDATNTPSTNSPAGGPARGMRGRGITFDNVAKQLDLTDDQKPKVKPIIDGIQQKMLEIRKDDSLAQEDRRAKMKETMDDATAKLKDVLTADQFDKWQKMIARRRAAAGAGGPPPATGDAKPPAASE